MHTRIPADDVELRSWLDTELTKRDPKGCRRGRHRLRIEFPAPDKRTSIKNTVVVTCWLWTAIDGGEIKWDGR